MKHIIFLTIATLSFFATEKLIAQSAQSSNQQFIAENASHISSISDRFEAIKTKKLPRTIIKAVARDFENVKIVKAYTNKDVYKIVLQENNNTAITVYANAKGRWIKPKQ